MQNLNQLPKVSTNIPLCYLYKAFNKLQRKYDMYVVCSFIKVIYIVRRPQNYDKFIAT